MPGCKQAIYGSGVDDRFGARAFHIVDAGQGLTGAHLVAQFHTDFEQAAGLAGYKTTIIRHVNIDGRGDVQITCQHACVFQNVLHTLFGDGYG